MEKGLIIKPTQSLQLGLYTDDIFSGLGNMEESTDPICTKLRRGFIIMISKVPLIWKSKHQTETALSTMESEYIALSTSMQKLISMRDLFNKVRNIQL